MLDVRQGQEVMRGQISIFNWLGMRRQEMQEAQKNKPIATSDSNKADSITKGNA